MSKLYHWIARKLPKKIKYWVIIDVWSIASTGKYANEESPGLNITQILDGLND